MIDLLNNSTAIYIKLITLVTYHCLYLNMFIGYKCLLQISNNVIAAKCCQHYTSMRRVVIHIA